MQNATEARSASSAPAKATPPALILPNRVGDAAQEDRQQNKVQQKASVDQQPNRVDVPGGHPPSAYDPMVICTVLLVVLNAFLVATSFLQWRAISRQARLLRDEFTATHRPRIRARAFQLTSSTDMNPNEPLRAVFRAQNIGESPAILTEIRSATYLCGNKERLPGDLTFPHAEKLSLRLECGTSELVPLNGGDVIASEHAMSVFLGDRALYFLGTLTYVDEGQTATRVTGFCRRYRSREGRWEEVQGDYEYEF